MNALDKTKTTMNNDQTIIPEVLPPESETKLVKYAGSTGLEKQSTETLVEAFRPIFAKSRAAILDAQKAEDDRKAAEVAAAAKAAKESTRAVAAADGVKLQRFAEAIRLLPKPILKDAALRSDLQSRVEKLAAWSEMATEAQLL